MSVSDSMASVRVLRYDTVTSTNDVALDLARSGEPEGTVVVAREQTKGRGRRERTWWDEPGRSLLMSAILAPHRPLAEFHQLGFVASLAAVELLQDACQLTEITLKWPNDVLAHGRKIAGILVEVTRCQGRPVAVVGIGINILQTSFPPDLASAATSVTIEGGACADPSELAETAARTLFAAYERLLSRGFKDILSSSMKYMDGLGKQAEVRTEGRVLRGTIRGLDETGALLLEKSPGDVHPIHSAETIHMHIDRFSGGYIDGKGSSADR